MRATLPDDLKSGWAAVRDRGQANERIGPLSEEHRQRRVDVVRRPQGRRWLHDTHIVEISLARAAEFAEGMRHKVDRW